MKILGIESSADESSLAIVEDGRLVRKLEIASQINKHKPYGGIVPELAARRHLANLPKMFDKLISQEDLADISAIAVTVEPGLPPALQVGTSFAKGLAYATGKPLLEINHVHAHAYAPFVDNNYLDLTPQFPLLALVVSGGHTQLMLFKKSFHDFEVIGSTMDDAAGEAFDKVARMLGLEYPGGPVIEKLALEGDEQTHKFPRALIKKENFDFSFSGLKTAVRYHIEKNVTQLFGESSLAVGESGSTKLINKDVSRLLQNYALADVAASFQEAVIDVLVHKTLKAAVKTKAKMVVLGGGVAANAKLRNRLGYRLGEQKVTFLTPDISYCLDNAAMIAGLGWHFL